MPRITAPVAVITAMLSEIHAASRISSLCSSTKYHLSVGEFAASHTVTSFEVLKENTTIDMIGKYRKANPNARQAREKTAGISSRGRQLAPLDALEHHDGHTSSKSMRIATALATGQARFEKNSSHSTRPIISGSGRRAAPE